MNEIKAKSTNEQILLDVKEQNIENVNEVKCTPLINGDFQAFEKLHNEIFPNTYSC